MTVELLQHGSVKVMMRAARKSHKSEHVLDSTDSVLGPKDEKLFIMLLKMGHHSVFEHLTYTFEIDGISRALLQQLARHRHVSLTVQSTRFALKKILDIPDDKLYTLIVPPCTNIDDSDDLNYHNYRDIVDQAVESLKLIKRLLRPNDPNAFEAPITNDIAKYGLPESLKTSLVMTVNMRELMHILSLRLDEHAMCEFRKLAKALYKEVEAVHKHWKIVADYFEWYRWL